MINFNDIKVGDKVRIRYIDEIVGYNKKYEGNIILITNIHNGLLKAVWCEGDDYDGVRYIISKYQYIEEILERGINVKEFLDTHNPIIITDVEKPYKMPGEE